MYKKTNGAMNLYQMEQLVPIQEMIKVKMPERIGEEYAKLLGKNEENTFNLKETKERFIERLIKEVSEKAKEEKQPISTFMKYIGETDEEQTQALIKYIKKYKPDASEEEFRKIQRIANGEEEEFVYIKQKNLKNNNGTNIEVIQECISSGLIKKLGEMDGDERKRTLQVINSSLEKRIEKKNTQPTIDQVDKLAGNRKTESEGYGEI